MGQTKLISIRVSEETLNEIDKVVRNTHARARSSVINAILDNVVRCASFGTMTRLVRTYDAYSSGYEVTFDKKQ